MQKCTLLSWGLRLPRATLMCMCYSMCKIVQAAAAHTMPVRLSNAFIVLSIARVALSEVHMVKVLLPDGQLGRCIC